MRKPRDLAWAREMHNQKPPRQYSPTLFEAIALASLQDPIEVVSASYNYGFIRGQRCEKARAKKEREA